jgi:hypothetical protein
MGTVPKDPEEPTWWSESGGAILLLLGLALLVGLVAGLGAQRYTQHLERPVVLYQHQGPSKTAAALGYDSDEDYIADRTRERAVIEKLLAAPVGTQLLWENPKLGNRAVILVTRDGARPDGAQCRELMRHSLVNEHFHATVATVCRAADGKAEEEILWRAEPGASAKP